MISLTSPSDLNEPACRKPSHPVKRFAGDKAQLKEGQLCGLQTIGCRDQGRLRSASESIVGRGQGKREKPREKAHRQVRESVSV